MSTILTLALDPASQAHFDHMRQSHFPPDRNLVPAHLTLFHTLAAPDEVISILAEVAARWTPFPLRINGLRSLGRGVAYTVDSPPLLAMHRELVDRFRTQLTPQDTQKFSPHVVVQNKSTPERARILLDSLRSGFTPFSCRAEGLTLWLYLNGPWQLAQTLPFTPEP